MKYCYLAKGCGLVMIKCDESGYVEICDERFWYQIYGADKKGIPLIVVNGGPGCSMSYLIEPIALLSDKRPVIFYDQRDSGKSENGRDKSLWTLEKFVEDFSNILEYFNFDKVHMLGQSWGTMLIVEYILKNKPSNIMSLIFSASCFSSPLWASDQKRLLKSIPHDLRSSIEECESKKDFNSHSYIDAINYYYKLHLCRSEIWPECLDDINLELYEYMVGPSEFTITGILKDCTCAERLEEIKLPTLLTCGEFDESTPETNEYYQKLIEGAELVVLPGTSHEHHLESPQAYLNTIGDFLQRVENQI